MLFAVRNSCTIFIYDHLLMCKWQKTVVTWCSPSARFAVEGVADGDRDRVHFNLHRGPTSCSNFWRQLTFWRAAPPPSYPLQLLARKSTSMRSMSRSACILTRTCPPVMRAHNTFAEKHPKNHLVKASKPFSDIWDIFRSLAVSMTSFFFCKLSICEQYSKGHGEATYVRRMQS